MQQKQAAQCSVDGCERRPKARGLCATHYAQRHRGVEPRPFQPRQPAAGSCEFAGCGEPVKAKGLCDAHYAHQLRHGHLRYKPRAKTERDTCSVDGCENWRYARGLCSMHYGMERNFRNVYRITMADYFAIVKAQDGKCAVCGRPEMLRDPRTHKMRHMPVDHDHVTGKVRGVICSNCNRALGLLGDNIDAVERIAAYLRRHQET